jgi:hypothetical protein
MSEEKPPADDAALEVYWDDLRVAPHRRTPREPSFRDQVKPGDFVIGTSRDRILVIIKPDGTLEYGPEYRPDETAVVFWESMGQRRLEMEDRLLVIGHMEAILTRLGDTDLRAESARRIAANHPDDMEFERQALEAIRRLEQVVTQAIELGRGLIRRPEIPMPAFPTEVPRSIQDVAHSDYEGRAGVGEDPEGPPEPQGDPDGLGQR